MSSSGRRAVVLGGGGVAGIAWESALVIALADAGVDLEDADVVVGTSAGSVVGTMLRAGRLRDWFTTQLDAPDGDLDTMGDLDVEPFVAAVAAASESRDDELATRARLGRVAIDSSAGRSEGDSVARIAGILGQSEWPDGELRVTAVDADSGEFRVIRSEDGVDLARAVTASCAVPGVYPTVGIEGRRYMDGGMRSGTNADVAGDCDRVLVISCGPEAPTSPLGPTLPQAVAELRARAEVLVIEADEQSLRAFGANSLLMSTRPASAAAGTRQGSAMVDRVRGFWA